MLCFLVTSPGQKPIDSEQVSNSSFNVDDTTPWALSMDVQTLPSEPSVGIHTT